ncbi:MAG: hypothetical protein IJ568_03615 [Bacilli bacterium]|nr:hypothetical protein [Bacilli bacterium]
MNNATLSYVIGSENNIRRLNLESENLFNVDKYTSRFKNEEDFISHYYYKDKIDNFIKENGKNGRLVVSYTSGVNNRKDLVPLFNTNSNFIFRDDPYLGKITDVEKSRRLLFNSKNQLFTKLILSYKTFDNFLDNLIDITDEEKKCLESFGIETTIVSDINYVSFRGLFDYRLRVGKLGFLRNLYEDMINSIKKDIMSFDSNQFYLYNRELRIVIDKYYTLINYYSVKNLSVRDKNIELSNMFLRRNFKFM